MSIKRIIITLPDGDPNGIKVIEHGKLRLTGFLIPRSQIPNAKNFEGLTEPCLYILCQKEGQSVYIGESESFSGRVGDHLRKKIFWDTAIVFSGGMDKAEIKYIESIAIHAARDSGRYIVKNDKKSGSVLPDFRQQELQEYFQEMSLLISFFNYPIFEKTGRAVAKKENTWYCKLKKNNAIAVDDGSSFTILKDSLIDPGVRLSVKESFALKRKEIFEQKATLKDGTYVLNEDVSFSSANQAGQFCLGGHKNAWDTWRDETGRTMDEVIRQKL